MKKTNARLLVTATLCLALGATVPTMAQQAANPMTPERTAGYLSAVQMPKSVALIPAPPPAGSAAMAMDEEGNRKALALHGTPRFELAGQDAVLTMPAVAQTFSCALDVPVSMDRTPKTIALLRRVLVDAGVSTNDAKIAYQRTRPFVVNGRPTCTPQAESRLRNNGSYPSGHSAIGYAFGLVLSQVAPDRTDALVARGRAFGHSRAVCNVHWPSDVIEGQVVSAAVVARMNAEAAFRDDVAAARAEIEALRSQGAKSDRDCEAEAKALAVGR